MVTTAFVGIVSFQNAIEDRVSLLFLQFLENRRMPLSILNLNMENVYYGRPSNMMIAVYPLLCLKGPVLGLPATQADDPPFFLFTAQFLSRSDWVPTTRQDTEDEDWAQHVNSENFEEEDSDLSSYISGEEEEEDVDNQI